jgi:PEP-CTERM motif
MRKSLWIVPVLTLIAAIGAPTAHASMYTPTFTCTGTCVSVPTAPDVSFPSPTSITVTWDSAVFVVSLASPDLPTDTYGWHGNNINYPVIDIADATTGTSAIAIGTGPAGSADEIGGLSFTALSTPEPSSFALMLAGVGLLFVMRKRLATSVQQAS